MWLTISFSRRWTRGRLACGSRYSELYQIHRWKAWRSEGPACSTAFLPVRPIPLGFLYQKLDELIGPGEWKVTVDYPNYTLYIESAAQNQNYATELAFTINRIKPAHIVWVNAPFVRTGLLLSEIISSAQRIYNYRLGAWGAGAAALRNRRPGGSD